ncbi:MAG: DUF898 family protein [Pseudomonadota bacterium]
MQDPSSTNGSASAQERDGWHLAASHATTHSPSDTTWGTSWSGDRGKLFGIALWTGVLTILTLGFYRFWARTRIRQWYWSAIRPGGVPLEYTGSPYEKLLGFLVAVVILAFYIGIVNLLLMFASFSLLAQPQLAYALTLLGLVPIWFYATYRAERYLMARTRWMGIRFGLEPGAWGYALRACLHWVLTIVTLGLWHPCMRFALARYRHNRMWFGTKRLSQSGGLFLLYPAFIHILLAVALMILASVLVREEIMALANEFDITEFENVALSDTLPTAARLFVVAIPWFLFGLIYYSVVGRRLLVAQLSVGETQLDPQPRVGRIVLITVLGNLLRYVATVSVFFVGIVILLIAVATLAASGNLFDEPEVMFENLELAAQLPQWFTIALGALFYFLVFLIWNIFTHVFLIMPTWKHYASTLRIKGAGHITQIRQRARDDSEEAGGFAEALDVGAAI